MRYLIANLICTYMHAPHICDYFLENSIDGYVLVLLSRMNTWSHWKSCLQGWNHLLKRCMVLLASFPGLKHKRFRNEASGNRNVPAYMHLCICLELRLFILDFFFWTFAKAVRQNLEWKFRLGSRLPIYIGLFPARPLQCSLFAVRKSCAEFCTASGGLGTKVHIHLGQPFLSEMWFIDCSY